MAKILVLESDENNRENFRRCGFGGKIVGTVDEALEELSRGAYEVFTTNYIDDMSPFAKDSILYSREAIRLAIRVGIDVEIRTFSDSKNVISSLRKYHIPYDENKMHIFNREKFAPGESFEGSSRNNERI